MTHFMRRALELATLGRGHVSPNPMVGCLIVHDATQRILGEGWHQRYGEAHAERNALAAVRPADIHLLPQSTAFVTLEPCSHYGKQPPCADLLVEKQIGRVVCCNDDPFALVAGRGFAKLRAAGIPVEVGLLAQEGRWINARFFTFVEQQRPYIILKWAETADGFVAGVGGQPVQISGPLSQRLLHRWRSEEDAIMVGSNTARLDNPRLNVRLWPGPDPMRVVIDRQLELNPALHLFDGSQPTICYNLIKNETIGQTIYHQLKPNLSFLSQLLTDLHERRIQSILVEGGPALLNSFITAGLWDEMRVFRSPMLLGAFTPGEGIKAPVVRGKIISREQVGDDELSVYTK